MAPAMLYCLTLVHAHRGHLVQVRDLASEALALCEQTGNVPVASQVLSVLGSPHRHWMTTRPQFPTWTASPRRALPSASPNQVWSSSSPD
jgi:hypothetical protein